jgi:hypothetical protein
VKVSVLGNIVSREESFKEFAGDNELSFPTDAASALGVTDEFFLSTNIGEPIIPKDTIYIGVMRERLEIVC